MLTDSALLLPVVVALSYAVGGVDWAAGTLAGGVVAWVNLAVMSVLVHRLTRAVAAGRSGAAAIGIMGLKLLVVVAAFLFLVSVFHPLSVAMGLGSAVMAMSLRPMFDVLRDVDDADIAANGGQT